MPYFFGVFDLISQKITVTVRVYCDFYCDYFKETGTIAVISDSPFIIYSSSSFKTLMKASCGTSTDPTCLIRFLPSFCFSSSFFLREISPP